MAKQAEPSSKKPHSLTHESFTKKRKYTVCGCLVNLDSMGSQFTKQILWSIHNTQKYGKIRGFPFYILKFREKSTFCGCSVNLDSVIVGVGPNSSKTDWGNERTARWSPQKKNMNSNIYFQIVFLYPSPPCLPPPPSTELIGNIYMKHRIYLWVAIKEIGIRLIP